jgi:hypothetical protein
VFTHLVDVKCGDHTGKSGEMKGVCGDFDPIVNTMNRHFNSGSVDNLVESIVALNPGADREWLVTFDAYDLARYLQHLECALEPRESATPWERIGDTPAIVSRTAA